MHSIFLRPALFYYHIASKSFCNEFSVTIGDLDISNMKASTVVNESASSNEVAFDGCGNEVNFQLRGGSALAGLDYRGGRINEGVVG